MGRPPRRGSAANIVVSVRLTEDEAEVLDSRRGDLSRPEYLRTTGLHLVAEKHMPGPPRGGPVEVAHDEVGAYLRPAARPGGETHPFLGVGKRCGRCGNERGGYSHP